MRLNLTNSVAMSLTAARRRGLALPRRRPIIYANMSPLLGSYPDHRRSSLIAIDLGGLVSLHAPLAVAGRGSCSCGAGSIRDSYVVDTPCVFCEREMIVFGMWNGSSSVVGNVLMVVSPTATGCLVWKESKVSLVCSAPLD
jgi:hypothetical protein